LIVATFHCNASIGKAGSAGSHAAYIMGLDEYADKAEVVKTGFGNLPKFAPDPMAFFKAADKWERESKIVTNKRGEKVEHKAQAYQGLIIAIPTEAKDPVFWAKELVREIAGDQAYAYGIHLKEGNPHLHLMMSQRGNKPDLEPDKYFSRKNGKNRDMAQRSWLDGVKQNYLGHIRRVAPSYTPAMTGGKEKQYKRFQSRLIEGERAARGQPDFIRERSALDKQISNFEEPKRTRALDRVLSKPAEPKPAPFKGFTSPKVLADIEKMKARAAGPSPSAPKSMAERIGESSAQKKIQREMEQSKREAAQELKASERGTKAEMDAEFRRVWAPKGPR
jgi:hypothetical protein